MRRYSGIRPRNVTADRSEIDAVLAEVSKHCRLWLLFCSDLAMRSGTAARIGPCDYNPEARELRFTTKGGARLDLPVTAEIEALIAECSMNSEQSFVRQLWTRTTGPEPGPIEIGVDALRKEFRRALKATGIKRRIVPHDLRRTTAVQMLRQTHDVRDVQAILGHRSLQSTIWYLDHELRSVKRSTLEILKRPAWRKDKTG